MKTHPTSVATDPGPAATLAGIRSHHMAAALVRVAGRGTAAACLVGLLAGCGQKGELTLPGRAAATAATPAAAAASDAASAPDTPWHVDPRRVP